MKQLGYSPRALLVAAICGLLALSQAHGQTPRFVWQRSIGTTHGQEQATRMIRCRAGGYVVVGRIADSLTTIFSTYVVRLDEQGATRWERRIPPGPNFQHEGVAIAENRSGQLLVGTSVTRLDTAFRYDARLDLLSPTGQPIWHQIYSSPRPEHVRSLQLANDGHFVGISTLLGQQSVFKFDSTGAEIWRRAFSLDSTTQGSLFDVLPVPDGYVVTNAFYRTIQPFGWLARLIRTDEDGNELYRRPAPARDPRIVRSTTDSRGELLYAHNWFSRVSAQTDTLWTRDYPSFGSARAVTALSDGNVLLLGDKHTAGDYDLSLAKIAPDGTLLFDTVFYRPLGYETPLDVAEDSLGNYVVCANTSVGLNGRRSIVLLKLRPWTITLGLPTPAFPVPISLYPNPAHDIVRLQSTVPLHGTLHLRDPLSRLVRIYSLSADSSLTDKPLSLAGLPAGLYLLSFTSSESSLPPSRHFWRLIKQ